MSRLPSTWRFWVLVLSMTQSTSGSYQEVVPRRFLIWFSLRETPIIVYLASMNVKFNCQDQERDRLKPNPERFKDITIIAPITPWRDCTFPRWRGSIAGNPCQLSVDHHSSSQVYISPKSKPWNFTWSLPPMGGKQMPFLPFQPDS